MNKIVSAELDTNAQWLNFEISKLELIFFGKDRTSCCILNSPRFLCFDFF